MPVVIPIIAVYASGALAAVAAGTATFAAYAAVAGAVLSTVGAITGSKDLQRIGAVVGIVGGAASLIDGASTAASTASTASDVAPAVDESAAETARLASQEAAATGSAAPSISDAAAQTAQTAPVSSTAAPDPYAGQVPASTPPPQYAGPGSEGAGALTDSTTGSIVDAARANGIATGDTTTQLATNNNGSVDYSKAPDSTGSQSEIQKNVSNYTSNDLNAWWDKAMKAGKAVGSVIKDNKELVNLAGGALNSIYGPQAEALDYQKSIMDRARANLNSPVVIKYNKPQGA